MSTTKGGSESSASEIRSASEEPLEQPAAFTMNLWQRPLTEKMDVDKVSNLHIQQEQYYLRINLNFLLCIKTHMLKSSAVTQKHPSPATDKRDRF